MDVSCPIPRSRCSASAPGWSITSQSTTASLTMFIGKLGTRTRTKDAESKLSHMLPVAFMAKPCMWGGQMQHSLALIVRQSSEVMSTSKVHQVTLWCHSAITLNVSTPVCQFQSFNPAQCPLHVNAGTPTVSASLPQMS